MSAHFALGEDGDLTAEPSDGPGRRLRIARQAKGVELDGIADELHLSATMIRALENDDYGALPGQVFVVAYIRKYARLVGLDPESLIAGYRAAAPQTEPAPTDHLPRAARQIGSGHLLVRLVSTAILVTLGALTFLWWQGQQQGSAGIEIADSETEPEAALSATTEAVPGPVTSDFALETVLVATAADSRRVELEANARPRKPERPPELDTRDTQPTAAAGTEIPTRVAGRGPADYGQVAAAETAPDPIAQDAQEPAAESDGQEGGAAADPGEILLSFSGPCWVDVRDSESKYKLFGEMKKGDRHVLKGTPPYSVILGNAAAVQITIDGEAIDISAMSRGNVARFTLDPDEMP